MNQYTPYSNDDLMSQDEIRALVREELEKRGVQKKDGKVIMLVQPETYETFRRAVHTLYPDWPEITRTKYVESLIVAFLEKNILEPAAN